VTNDRKTAEGARTLLTPREFEAWSFERAGLRKVEIARRMGFSQQSRVTQLLHRAHTKLGEPVTTKPKQSGYRPVKQQRIEQARAAENLTRARLGWFDRCYSLLPAPAQREIVDEDVRRKLLRLGVADGANARREFLLNNGSVEWCREHLTTEALGFLERTLTDATIDDVLAEDDVDGRDVSAEAYVLGSRMFDEGHTAYTSDNGGRQRQDRGLFIPKRVRPPIVVADPGYDGEDDF
jgi:hypothetical protein